MVNAGYLHNGLLNGHASIRISVLRIDTTTTAQYRPNVVKEESKLTAIRFTCFSLLPPPTLSAEAGLE